MLGLVGLLADTGRLAPGSTLRAAAQPVEPMPGGDLRPTPLLPCTLLVGAPGGPERPLPDLLRVGFSRDWVRQNISAGNARVPLAIVAADARLDPGPSGFAEILVQAAQLVASRAAPPLSAYWARLVPGLLGAAARALSQLEADRESLSAPGREAIRGALLAYADPRTPRGVAIEEMAHRMAALRISEIGL
jgi:hypothetical protein